MFMSIGSRYLLYEKTNGSTYPDYGQIVNIVSDKVVDIALSGGDFILESVPVDDGYVPKIGEWVEVQWRGSTPYVVGTNTAMSGLVNINEQVKVVSPNDIANGVVSGNHIRVDSIASKHIQADTIESRHIKAEAVQAQHISANSITSNHIKANSIEAQHIKAGAVTAQAISANSITASHIQSNAITTNHIQANSITSSLIQAQAIQSQHISSDAIAANMIQAEAIQSHHISAEAITSQHISAEAITSRHISSNSITSEHISANSIESQHIKASAVTAEAISANSIGVTHIQSNSIAANMIQAGAVQSQHISANSINSGHIQSESIDSVHIKASSINSSHISANSIDTQHVKAGAITAQLIAADSINSSHIQANTIESKHVKANAITAQAISANSITSSHIQSNTIASNHIQANAIQSHHVSANIIQSDHISANSIMSVHIRAGAVTSQAIQANSINSTHIQANAINSVHISANSITSNMIQSNAVQSQHISANSINSGHVQANAITSTHIAAGAITALHISANSIASTHITASAIQSTHISANAVQAQHIASNSIQARHISANSITSAMISANSIQSQHITASAIQSMHISANAVQAQHISANSIGTNHISANSIMGAHIKSSQIQSQHISANAIQAVHISANTIQSQHISANSINSSHIVANAITSSHISAGAITVDHLTVSTKQMGLLGQYFSGNNFNLYKGQQIDGLINFNWGTGSPSIIGTNDNFSIRWQGFIFAPESGQYVFRAKGDGTVKLSVNNTTLISGSATSSELTANINLVSGNWYPITFEYIEDTGNASVYLKWTRPSLVTEDIPAKYLSPGVTEIDGSTIRTGTITAAQMKVGTITAESGVIAAAAITTANIQDGAITSAKIGFAEVQGIHIKAGTIDNIHIKDASIEHTKIRSVDAGTITVGYLSGQRIAAQTITGYHISANTIDGTHLKFNTIDGNHIKAGAITAINIASEAIQARHIGAEQITSEKIRVGSIESYHISTVGLDAETVTVYSSTTGETLIGGGFLRVGGLDAGVVQSDNLVNNGSFLVASSEWGLARDNVPGESILGLQNTAPGGSTIWKFNMMSNPPTVVKNDIVAGKKPAAIVIDPVGAYAYVANSGDRTVSKIDLVNNVEVGSVNVGSEPMIIRATPDWKYLLVPNSDLSNRSEPDSLTIIDVATFTVVANLNVGMSPFDVAITPDSKIAYLSCAWQNDIYIIDLTAMKVVGAINVGWDRFPLGVALSADGRYLYTCNSLSDSVSVVDLSTRTIAAEILVGDAPVQCKLYNGKLYVSCGGSNSVYVINTSTNAVEAVIPVGVKPTDIAINPFVGTAGYMFVACGGSNAVVIVDIAIKQAIGFLSTGANPMGLAFSPTYQYLYVTNNGDSAIISFVYPEGDYIGDAYVGSDGQVRYNGADGWVPNRSNWVYDASGNVIGASIVEFHIGEPLNNEGGYVKLTTVGLVDQIAYVEQDIYAATNFSDGSNLATTQQERLRPKDSLSTSGNTEFYPLNEWLTSPAPKIYLATSGGVQLVSANQYTIYTNPARVVFNSLVSAGTYVLADYTYRDNVWFKEHNASVKAFSEQPVSDNYHLFFEVDELVPKFVVVEDTQTTPFTPTSDGVTDTYEGITLSAMTNRALNLPSGKVTANDTYNYGSGNSSDISRVVNGNLDTNNYYQASSGNRYVQLDLGDVYMVNTIKVWHYYGDGRRYNGNITQVSADGTNWINVWDYRIHGTYVETASGNTITFPAMPVRYIRDYISGNTVNNSNHWVQIQAFADWKLEAGEIISTPLGDMPKYTAAIKAKNPSANGTIITTDVSGAYLEYRIKIDFTSDWYLNYITAPEFGVAKVLIDGVQDVQPDGIRNFYIFQNNNGVDYSYYRGTKLKPGWHTIRIEQTTGKINFDRFRFEDYQQYARTSLEINNANTYWERYKIVPKDAQYYVGVGRQTTTGPYDTVRVSPKTGQPDGSVPIKYRVRIKSQLVGDGTPKRGVSYATGVIFEEGKQHTHWRMSQTLEKVPSSKIEPWDINKPHETGIQAKHIADGAIHGRKILSSSIMDYHISPHAKIAEFKLDLNYPTHPHPNKDILDSITGWAGSGGIYGTSTTLSRGDHHHDDKYFKLTGGTISGATTFASGITVSGNITVTGTVDGVDISSLNNLVNSHIGSGGSAHPLANGSTAGFMSSSHYTKLQGIADGATKVESSATNGNIKINGVETTVYTHPSGAGYNHIPSGGASGNFLKWSSNGVATWASVSWNDITSKPATFTPSSHTHTVSQITDLAANYYNKTEVNTMLASVGDVKANAQNTFTDTNTFNKAGLAIVVRPSANVAGTTTLFTINQYSGNSIFSVEHGNVVKVNGDLQVTGQMVYSGTQNVIGDQVVSGDLYVSGNSFLGNDPTDTTIVQGTLRVNGGLVQVGKLVEVMRFPIYGVGGDLQFQTDSNTFEEIVSHYWTFDNGGNSALPPIPQGATRKFKLLISYSTTGATSPATLRIVQYGTSTVITSIALPTVNGSATGMVRTFLSPEFTTSYTGHTTFQAKADNLGTSLVIKYIELIAYDYYAS